MRHSSHLYHIDLTRVYATLAILITTSRSRSTSLSLFEPAANSLSSLRQRRSRLSLLLPPNLAGRVPRASCFALSSKKSLPAGGCERRSRGVERSDDHLASHHCSRMCDGDIKGKEGGLATGWTAQISTRYCLVRAAFCGAISFFPLEPGSILQANRRSVVPNDLPQIGRASCRERV